MATKKGLAVVALGIAVSAGAGVFLLQDVFAQSSSPSNAALATIPSPRTFRTNHLPIPKVIQAVPKGVIPKGVTIAEGKARALAIAWIEQHRPSKAIVPPVITNIKLVTASEVEVKAGAQPGLPPYLWQISFTMAKPDFDVMGLVRSAGTVWVNSQNGTIPIVFGASH